MLTLIATPIGNLGDLSPRAIEALKRASYILAEDTRHTAGLLSHFDIHTRLVSYHKFSERAKEDAILEDLREGKEIALVSDAGMPTIADPGMLIVKRCREEKIAVTCIPGPSALITALALSGLPHERFQFLGFIPKKTSEIKALFTTALTYPGVSIFYETPHHLTKSLPHLPPDTLVTIARELTKLHEECVQGTPTEILAHFQTTPLKGELVLLISGQSSPTSLRPPISDAELLTLLEEHLSHKTAALIAAKITGRSRNDFY